MAYKNPKDKTDYQREYMRKRRAAEKLEKTHGVANIATEIIGQAIIEDISETDPVILDILDENPDLTAEQVIRIYTRLMQGKKKDKKASLKDIPDLIFKHIDTQFIQIAGGGNPCHL